MNEHFKIDIGTQECEGAHCQHTKYIIRQQVVFPILISLCPAEHSQNFYREEHSKLHNFIRILRRKLLKLLATNFRQGYRNCNLRVHRKIYRLKNVNKITPTTQIPKTNPQFERKISICIIYRQKQSCCLIELKTKIVTSIFFQWPNWITEMFYLNENLRCFSKYLPSPTPGPKSSTVIRSSLFINDLRGSNEKLFWTKYDK